MYLLTNAFTNYKQVHLLSTRVPFFVGGGCAKNVSIKTHNMRLLISVKYFEKFKILDYSISITYCL